MAHITVLGYGNQGRAHALNLRDSGLDVVIGQRPGASFADAVEAGFEVKSLADAVVGGEVVVLALPDESCAALYETEIAEQLEPGALLVFIHGFNIVHGLIKPRSDLDVGMVSPKGPGVALRQQFTEGNGLPALLAVHQDASGRAWKRVEQYAWGIGCTRSLMLRTSFRSETITDLFGEQAVLCGGIPELIKCGFETLVEAGYQPELAYFECLFETKLIVDLIVAHGIAGMREMISGTAAFGGLSSGTALINRQAVKDCLARIESLEFGLGWVAEAQQGGQHFEAMKRAEAQHPVEDVGARIREHLRLGSPTALEDGQSL